MKHRGFEISIEHHAIRCRMFPNGVFYGTVDGRGCTGPFSNKDSAMEAAIHQLENGGLIATLKTSIDCMNGWIKSGNAVEEAESRINVETKLLNKIYDHRRTLPAIGADLV